MLQEEHPFLNYVKNMETIPHEGNLNYASNQEFADIVFDSKQLRGLIKYSVRNNTLFVTVAGTLQDASGGTLEYIAAAPITRGYSYSGSGLPFPNPDVAYECTPSVGSIAIDADGDFSFTIEYPNSYYVRQGTLLIDPHVHLYRHSSGDIFSINVGESLANRSLTSLPDRPNRSIGR